VQRTSSLTSGAFSWGIDCSMKRAVRRISRYHDGNFYSTKTPRTGASDSSHLMPRSRLARRLCWLE
jgi:hypothetical protein